MSDERKIGKLTYFPAKLLGEGAFGSVHKGKLEDGSTVAVKKILQEKSDIINAERNYWALQKNIQHDNIARYIHFKEDDNFIFIAMDLYPGTLTDLVANTIKVKLPGPNEEILRHQVTIGLQYLHSKGIVHRDIKPHNILVTTNGVMKLADFGLCKQHKNEITGFTKTDTIGTLGWAAPELYAQDTARYRYSVDIFSLGCVFGFVLTRGEHLFGEPVERTKNIVTGKINKKVVNSIHDDILRILTRKMVSSEPGRRPSLQHILLDVLQCLIKWYANSSDRNAGDELMKTINRIAETGKDCTRTNGTGSGSILLALCKSANENKLLCLKKVLLELLDVLQLDVNETDRENRTALTALLENPLDDVVILSELTKLLISSTLAIKHEIRCDYVELLLENGANPSVCNKEGWTPVNLACRYYKSASLKDLLNSLIKRQASFDERPACGNSALAFVVRHYPQSNLAQVMSVLINAGAVVHHKNVENNDALMQLCRFYEGNFVPAFKILIDRGIDVRQKNNNGWTALHFAIRYFGNNRPQHQLFDVVSELLKRGADADACGNNGWTPLFLASNNSRREYYKRDDLIDVIRLLIEQGANPDRRLRESDDNALTLVVRHQTQQENISDIVNIFTKADVNCKNSKNLNTLMLLCRYYDGAEDLFPSVELLVTRGINVNEKTENRWTALHCLMKYFGNRREKLSELVRLLLENGAEADATQTGGRRFFTLRSAITRRTISPKCSICLSTMAPILAIVCPTATTSSRSVACTKENKPT